MAEDGAGTRTTEIDIPPSTHRLKQEQRWEQVCAVRVQSPEDTDEKSTDYPAGCTRADKRQVQA